MMSASGQRHKLIGTAQFAPKDNFWSVVEEYLPDTAGAAAADRALTKQIPIVSSKTDGGR